MIQGVAAAAQRLLGILEEVIDTLRGGEHLTPSQRFHVAAAFQRHREAVAVAAQYIDDHKLTRVWRA